MRVLVEAYDAEQTVVCVFFPKLPNVAGIMSELASVPGIYKMIIY